MFNIHQATEKDIPAIREIAEKTWWPTYSPFIPQGQIRYMLDTLYAAETMKNDILTTAQTYLVLEDESGSQGFASFSRRQDEPGVYKLHKLYVIPENHGMGYGRALIDEIKGRLLQEDIHILDLNVNRKNPARSFYEKLGFVVLREEDIPIGPFWMNDYVMRLTF